MHRPLNLTDHEKSIYKPAKYLAHAEDCREKTTYLGNHFQEIFEINLCDEHLLRQHVS